MKLIQYFIILFIANSCNHNNIHVKKAEEKLFNNNAEDFKEKSFVSNEDVVIAATEEARKVGREILNQGGSAAEAVIAMQMAIGLTEPHASSLGGGGYVLNYNRKNKKITSYDGKEIAPSYLKRGDVFKKYSDELNYREEYHPNYIGVPGALLLMKDLYQDSNKKLSWNNLIQPSIKLAEDGFVVENRLRLVYNKYRKHTHNINELFDNIKDDRDIEIGEKLHNKKLANFMKQISNIKNVDSFYNGEIRDYMLEKLKFNENNFFHQKDFENYRIIKQEASCVKYKKKYKICTRNNYFPILSSFKILENFDFTNFKSGNDPKLIHLVAEAVNFAISNKRKYDDHFLVNEKISEKILSKKAIQYAIKQIDTKIKKNKEISTLYGLSELENTKKDNQHGTTTFAAVDKDGNIALAVTSVNGYFGSGIVIDGIVMNNTMIDFSNCENCINEVKAYKRTSSSMSPIIVFDNKDNPIFVASSAGGIRILSYVVSTLINMIELNYNPQEAINEVKYSVHNNGNIMVEKNKLAKNNIEILNQMGHNVVESEDVISGLLAIKLEYKENGKIKSILAGKETRRWASVG